MPRFLIPLASPKTSVAPRPSASVSSAAYASSLPTHQTRCYWLKAHCRHRPPHLQSLALPKFPVPLVAEKRHRKWHCTIKSEIQNPQITVHFHSAVVSHMVLYTDVLYWCYNLMHIVVLQTFSIQVLRSIKAIIDHLPLCHECRTLERCMRGGTSNCSAATSSG